jgi:toxin ParE1/3/4
MYKVIRSEQFRQDMVASVDYIVGKLEAPRAAHNLVSEVKAQSDKLAENPLRRPLVQDAYLAARGYRCVAIKNYNLFYTVDEDKQIVNLVRFMYCHRDWQELLSAEK